MLGNFCLVNTFLVLLIFIIVHTRDLKHLQIRSFREGLRPLLIMDGAHLKGDYVGLMFLAVGMDANNQICPIAMGVGKSESGQAWTWFLRRLRGCIGEPSI